MNRKWMFGKRNKLLRLWNTYDFVSKPKFYCNACERAIRHAIDSPRHDSPVFAKLRIVGGGLRRNQQCPFCLANDRMRFTLEVLKQYTDMMKVPCQVLEIAPIAGLELYLKKHARCEYVSGDIAPGRAQRVLDITRLDLPSESFDYLICCHVMEHISDEAAALAEIRRVLKPGGCALLSMPISLSTERTFETTSANTPAKRLEIYGQDDHVRLYGLDTAARLKRFGFDVREIVAKDAMPDLVAKLKLIPEDRNYLCRKA